MSAQHPDAGHVFTSTGQVALVGDLLFPTMLGSPLPTVEDMPPAMLLVLLPAATSEPPFASDAVAALERELGGAVRVLVVDEASSSAVVRSFAPQYLPACVLVHQGVELWRQIGLPDSNEIAPILLMRLAALHL